MRKAVDEESAVGKALDKSRSNESLTKLEREYRIVEAARVFTHLAHHENKEPEIFSRDDACMLLSIATAAVASAISRVDL
jgi:hypothetical protein